MKLVVAIVRPEMLNDVLEALYRAEVRGLTIRRVEGHGGETEEVETYRGTRIKVEAARQGAAGDRCLRPFRRADGARDSVSGINGRRGRRKDLRAAGREGVPHQDGGAGTRPP